MALRLSCIMLRCAIGLRPLATPRHSPRPPPHTSRTHLTCMRTFLSAQQSYKPGSHSHVRAFRGSRARPGASLLNAPRTRRHAALSRLRCHQTPLGALWPPRGTKLTSYSCTLPTIGQRREAGAVTLPPAATRRVGQRPPHMTPCPAAWPPADGRPLHASTQGDAPAAPGRRS